MNQSTSFLPLLSSNVSGYVIALSDETEHSRTMAKIYAETGRAVARFNVRNPKLQDYTVELYYSLNSNPLPYGYSVDGRDDFSGSLSFDGKELVDFDGLACLPKTVCATLRALGFTVSDDCLTSPL